LPGEDYLETFIWSIPKGPKKALKGTMTVPTGKGADDATYGGEFITPAHPDGVSAADLDDDDRKYLKDLLNKEMPAVNQKDAMRYSSAPRFRTGSLYVTQLHVHVFVQVPSTIRARKRVMFSAGTQTDLGTTEIKFFGWTLGNGQTALGSSVNTVYKHPGKFVLRVRVLDNVGARGMARRVIRVLPTSGRKSVPHRRPRISQL